MSLADEMADLAAPAPRASTRCGCCRALTLLEHDDAETVRAIIRGEIANPRTGKVFTDHEVAAWLSSRLTVDLLFQDVANCRLRHFGVRRRR